MTCDHPGCGRRFNPRPGRRDVTSLRRHSMVEGWSRSSKGGDLCPEHTDPSWIALRSRSADSLLKKWAE